MEIRRIEISKIQPAVYNPRKDLKPDDKEYQHIKNSMEQFGYIDPIIWNERTGNLVGGHQRFKILKESGATEIECVVVNFDEEKEKAANMAVNKAQGDWDINSLNDLLKEVKAYDMTDFGFDIIDSNEVVEDEFDIDAAIPEIPITNNGDIWQIGRHRLMCGDSTMLEDVDRLMDGKKADMVFTDPPYNIAYEGGSKKREMIKNDKVSDFYQFLLDAYTALLVSTKAGASVYVTHADTERANFTQAFLDAGFYLSSVIIWVKNNSTFGRQDYKWKHEPILYGWNANGGHKYYGSAKEDTVWQIDRPSRSEDHPTMKPVLLITRALENSSKQEDIVLDVFGGSGSTLIACEQLNRICYMMELDEKYCDVIVKRWEEFTGQKAVRISEGQKTTDNALG